MLHKHFFHMTHLVGIHLEINYISPNLCKISKCICTITLTFDLRGQGQIVFPIFNYVGDISKSTLNILQYLLI